MKRIEILKENLDLAENKIQEALQLSGRKREEIRLIVVTKTHDAETVENLIHLGVLEIGESYVQEAIQKQNDLSMKDLKHMDVKWHMIGHVQSRKAASVVEKFSMLHSVDSLKLARRLNRAAAESSKVFPVLVQVNVSGEQSKFGFDAADENSWNLLLDQIAELLILKNLEPMGLMSIPPFDVDENVARKIYAKTRKLREYFRQQFPDNHWGELSMGMSGDFQSAINEGSTILRLGSVILGPRPTN